MKRDATARTRSHRASFLSRSRIVCRAMRYMMIFVLLISALGCGGGSGVDGGKYLNELTPDDLAKICQYGVDKQGAPGMKDCGNGTSTTVKTVDECKADTPPHCTVSVFEACVESIGGDACKLLSTPECATYIQCAASGG